MATKHVALNRWKVGILSVPNLSELEKMLLCMNKAKGNY